MKKLMNVNLLKRQTIFVMFFLMSVSFMFAQNKIKVSGTITDQNNEPLVGVSIVEKGVMNATATENDGKYTISVAQGATLVYSYIGYKTQEIAATSNVINVTLEEEVSQIDETVVIGYGIQKKSSVTGAISQVKTEDIQNRTITSPAQALQGKTAGVQIVQGSAAPGSSPTVRIRGISSNGSNEPLYVVDGRIASDIGGIDPNDIESMEVLKDAASAAIYGIAAGNGVVLITTKKGMAGKTSINYDFQTVIQSISRMPQVLNAEQYIDYMTEGNHLSMNQIMQDWDFKTNTNWSKEAMENSIMMRHNLSFMGGNSAGTYYLSLSYLNNDGYVKGDADTYQRYTATINGSYRIKPWLEVGTNNQIEYYKRRSVSEGSEYGSLLLALLQLDPLTPVTYAPDQLPAHMLNAIAQGRYLLQNENGDYYGLSAFQISDQVHPFVMRDRSATDTKGFNINGVVYLNLKPIKELTLTSRFAYRLSGMNMYSYGQPYYANSTVAQNYMSVNATASTPVSYQWENFANFVKSFGKHNVNAMLGISVRQNVSFSVGGSVEGSDTDLGFTKFNPRYAYFAYATPTATRRLSGGEETFGAMYSLFGRVSYDYANKYFFQASLRNDAADLSQLPPENRHGYFPAVSAGWTISNEEFMKPLHGKISFLKLRASWGQNGSLGSAYGYLWRASIGSTGYYSFYNADPATGAFIYNTGAAPTTLGNIELGWEKSEQLDFGLDARFFRDRLSLTVDYFDKTTKDLIVSGVTVSTIVGNTASPLNAGSISNKGVEIELGWRDRIGDFGYGIRANFASLKNEVTYIHESLDRISGVNFHTINGITVFEKGYPAWYFRGYKIKGIDAATGDVIIENVHTADDVVNPQTGAITEVINDSDKTMIGNPIPDFTYGITLTAAYKGFDLTVFGVGSQGNDIFMCLVRGDRSQTNILREFYDDRWTPTNTNASHPRSGAANIDRYWGSDGVVYDGSYFKIKQIQLGYTLPKSLLSKVSINNCRIYCSLDDFFTFTSYPGFDPETVGTGAGMGVDKGSYPNSKKIVFGINLTF
ncbi:MAG: TonB-dependent receptor [Prevotellaceae bacterium]|nr:TonB-dependent receptor [Prevotellaceae bacterium]